MVKVVLQFLRPNTKGSTMNRTIATVLLAAAAISGCASLPDSIKGPFARSSSGQTATDASANHSEVSPYPAATDEGKF
jgi:starvation-inducible outer membrane lipoprotein